MLTTLSTQGSALAQQDRPDLTGARPRGGRLPRFRITPRDREILRFAAVHRFVLACQVQALLGCDRAVAYRRLAGLRQVGLLTHERIFHAQPGVFRITGGGLDLIDSRLPVPKVDLRTYRHDVGLGWLWLAARDGRFGAPDAFISERELGSVSGEHQELLAGLPSDGHDRRGRERTHRPDLLIAPVGGGRVAVELELTLKGRRRLEAILLGYHAADRVTRVHYLTDSRPVHRTLAEMTVDYGLDGLIAVHYLPGSGRDPHWWLWPSIWQGGLR